MLGKHINKGLIKIIPKQVDASLLKNWRHVTFFNVFYKTVANALAYIIDKVLPGI